MKGIETVRVVPILLLSVRGCADREPRIEHLSHRGVLPSDGEQNRVTVVTQVVPYPGDAVMVAARSQPPPGWQRQAAIERDEDFCDQVHVRIVDIKVDRREPGMPPEMRHVLDDFDMMILRSSAVVEAVGDNKPNSPADVGYRPEHRDWKDGDR